MKKIIIIISLNIFTYHLYAQCCGAGNPISGFNNVSGISKNSLMISPFYKHSYSDQYFAGDTKADFNPDKMYYDYLSFGVAYGITKKISINGELGYFLNKTKEYNIHNYTPLKGNGLGDLELNAKYKLIENVIERIDITPSIGIKLPIGVFDQEVDNVKLPISLQPSSGSLKLNASVFATKKIADFSISVRGFFEYAKRIQSKNFDYKYGNLYLLAIYGSYKFNEKISVLSQFRYEYREKSVRENSEIVQSTGGQVVYFIPQINYVIIKTFGVSVFADFPIYRYMNGLQVANKYSVSIKLTKFFNLNKK